MEQRAQRQMMREAELDNMVVMLDRDLDGAKPMLDHLRQSHFIQHWVHASVHGCIGTPPQLSLMYCP